MKLNFSIANICKHIFYCLLAVVTHLLWMSILCIIVGKIGLGDAGTIAIMFVIGYSGILSYYAASKWTRK
jgi:hypothetical protein